MDKGLKIVLNAPGHLGCSNWKWKLEGHDKNKHNGSFVDVKASMNKFNFGKEAEYGVARYLEYQGTRLVSNIEIGRFGWGDRDSERVLAGFAEAARFYATDMGDAYGVRVEETGEDGNLVGVLRE